eukprot:9428623-Alexandrium_andersonii.AAC.1
MLLRANVRQSRVCTCVPTRAIRCGVCVVQRPLVLDMACVPRAVRRFLCDPTFSIAARHVDDPFSRALRTRCSSCYGLARMYLRTRASCERSVAVECWISVTRVCPLLTVPFPAEWS